MRINVFFSIFPIKYSLLLYRIDAPTKIFLDAFQHIAAYFTKEFINDTLAFIKESYWFLLHCYIAVDSKKE